MEKAPEGIDIKLGLELGEGNHDPARAKRIYAMPEYDFILGSLHNLQAASRTSTTYSTRATSTAASSTTAIWTSLSSSPALGCFDCMAHIGYCLRYMRKQGFDARAGPGPLRRARQTCCCARS